MSVCALSYDKYCMYSTWSKVITPPPIRASGTALNSAGLINTTFFDTRFYMNSLVYSTCHGHLDPKNLILLRGPRSVNFTLLAGAISAFIKKYSFVSISTIRNTIKLESSHSNQHSLPRSGTPKRLSPHQEAELLKKAEEDEHIKMHELQIMSIIVYQKALFDDYSKICINANGYNANGQKYSHSCRKTTSMGTRVCSIHFYGLETCYMD